MLRGLSEVLGDKAPVGGSMPAGARKSTWKYARRKHISSTFGRGFESLHLHIKSSLRRAFFCARDVVDENPAGGFLTAQRLRSDTEQDSLHLHYVVLPNFLAD